MMECVLVWLLTVLHRSSSFSASIDVIRTVLIDNIPTSTPRRINQGPTGGPGGMSDVSAS